MHAPHTQDPYSSRACYTGASNTPPCCDTSHEEQQTQWKACALHTSLTQQIGAKQRAVHVPLLKPLPFLMSFPATLVTHIPATLVTHIPVTHIPATFVTHSPATLVTHSPATFVAHNPATFIAHIPATLVTHNPMSVLVLCAAFRHAHTSQSCLLSVLCSVCRSPGSISMLDFSFLLKS
jgi:hypothetical protein